MKQPEPPCKDYVEREVRCHGTCTKYKEYRVQREKYNKIVRETKYPTDYLQWRTGKL